MNSLETQAGEHGIDLGFYDIDGVYHETMPEVLQAILQSLEQTDVSDGLFVDTLVVREQEAQTLYLPAAFHSAAQYRLENEAGESWALNAYDDNGNLRSALPELAAGYYVLSAETDGAVAKLRLIVAPKSAYQPKALSDGLRMNGLTTHLYSLRSERNWGIGDFTDLADLMAFAAEQQLDFIGINPLHALFTSRPAYASPYSPSSREWLNPIYLDVAKVAAFSYGEKAKKWLAQPNIQQRIAALRVTDTVTYTAVWAFKRDALQLAFNAFEKEGCEEAQREREAFAAFAAEKGEA